MEASITLHRLAQRIPYLWWSIGWSGISNVVGTVVGLAGSVAANGFDFSNVETGEDNTLNFYNNRIQSTAGSNTTYGHVICWAGSSPSAEQIEHEHAHVRQSDRLGPGYLGAHAILQMVSNAIYEAGYTEGPYGDLGDVWTWNPLEWGPDTAGQPWPWQAVP